MMAKNNRIKILFSHKVSGDPTSIRSLDTTSVFDKTVNDNIQAPIDNFYEKIRNLNLISQHVLDDITLQQSLKVTQNNLVLLGYISAVESYLREIIRKLILLDVPCRNYNQDIGLTYGAAITHSSSMLPEALMEGASFASQKNIIDSIKKHLGLSGHTPIQLLDSLEEFERICHLRHCVIHRFGKLGSNNAIRLGLESHKEYLEKPLILDANNLQNISLFCENVVIVINQYLFEEILKRTGDDKFNFWQWDFRKDRKLFSKYFNLFDSKINPSGSNINDAYNNLRNYISDKKLG